MIADLGGGTSNFTVLRLRPDAFSPDDVLAVGGIAIACDALDGALAREVIAPLLGSTAPYRLPTGSNELSMSGELLHLHCAPARLTLANERVVLENLDAIRRRLLDRRDALKLQRVMTLVADAMSFQFYEAVEATKIALSSRDLSELRFAYPGIDLDRPVCRGEFEAAVHVRIEQAAATTRLPPVLSLSPPLVHHGAVDGCTDITGQAPYSFDLRVVFESVLHPSPTSSPGQLESTLVMATVVPPWRMAGQCAGGTTDIGNLAFLFLTHWEPKSVLGLCE